MEVRSDRPPSPVDRTEPRPVQILQDITRNLRMPIASAEEIATDTCRLPDSGAISSATIDLMLAQRYVSNELTHFVGARLKTRKEQYDLLKQILKTRKLRAFPGPVERPKHILRRDTDAPLSSNRACEGSMVCFCDIPLCDLPLHMSKYSLFGLAFPKEFLADLGAMPVSYIPLKGRPSLLPYQKYGRGRVASQRVSFDHFWELFKKVEQESASLENGSALRRDLKRMMGFLEIHVISNFKFFDHLLFDEDDDHYYMEREWRVKQNVKFRLDDVARIIVPNAYGERIRKEFPGFKGEIVFADWEH